MSDSLQVHGLYSPLILCSWDPPGKNGVSSHFFPQGIFLTQRSKPGLLHCRKIIIQVTREAGQTTWINVIFESCRGFPDSSVGKESACNAGDSITGDSSIPGSERSTGEGTGYPLQYSWASLLPSWKRICLQSKRPGFHPWVGKIPWRRERLPTLVFWPGEFHGL